MICYKDKTFCTAECANYECDRMYTKEVVANAAKWWGNDEAPIAVRDMSNDCFMFILRKADA